MKKRIAILLALVFVLLLPFFVACNNYNGGGEGNNNTENNVQNNPTTPTIPENPVSDFEFRAIPGGIEITAFIGTSIRVRIPATIEDVAVTTIGFAAFEDAGIMEVFLPESLTAIAWRSFRDNPALTSIHIPNNVTTIGEGAFDGTGLTSVIIPDSMTSIGAGAFWNTPLTSVTIGNGVTYIGPWAFYDTQLTSVTIGNSTARIRAHTFSSTNAFTVTFDENIVNAAREDLRCSYGCTTCEINDEEARFVWPPNHIGNWDEDYDW